MLATITTISVALITALIGPLVVTWIKTKLEKSEKNTTLEEAFDHNAVIDQQLDTLIKEIECSKVWIAQFHNGGHFYPTGKSIQKFSIFYEKIIPEVNSSQTIFQNIPVSFFPKLFSRLYNDGELYYIDVTNHEEDHGLKMMVDKTTQSIFTFGIRNMDDEFIGIIAIEFNQCKSEFSREEYIFIRQKIGAISLLLSNYLKKTKK